MSNESVTQVVRHPNGQSWPCEECGAEVTARDIAKRGALRRLVEPDSAHGGETYETLCEVCASLAAPPALEDG